MLNTSERRIHLFNEKNRWKRLGNCDTWYNCWKLVCLTLIRIPWQTCKFFARQPKAFCLISRTKGRRIISGRYRRYTMGYGAMKRLNAIICVGVYCTDYIAFFVAIYMYILFYSNHRRAVKRDIAMEEMMIMIFPLERTHLNCAREAACFKCGFRLQ